LPTKIQSQYLIRENVEEFPVYIVETLELGQANIVRFLSNVVLKGDIALCFDLPAGIPGISGWKKGQ
jgi:hypothetical protein